MLIPLFWAERRLQVKQRRKKITIRRFGWSNDTQEAADAHAEMRAQEALERCIAGEKLSRIEVKRGYNGSEGVPIFEEIVSHHEGAIITRNSYGALCLNTDQVLLIDIDFDQRSSVKAFIFKFLIVPCIALLAWRGFNPQHLLLLAMLSLVLLWVGHQIAKGVAFIILERFQQMRHRGAEKIARRRIQDFITQNPTWNLRLYRTPAGLRAMATHQTFKANDPAVSACFTALGADPLYVKMCLKQQCFRARVSGKPWRMGFSTHLKKGSWPPSPELRTTRETWIHHYDRTAHSFAACRFITTVGSGVQTIAISRIQQLHDELSGALSDRPLA